MNIIYASDQFNQVIWPDFTAHFQNESTEASYRSDVVEFMAIYQTDFLQITEKIVEDYYARMQERVESDLVQPSTMAKKFRELHSLASFIYEEREQYQIPDTFYDYFFPYLKYVAKTEKHAKSIPIDHIDKILIAAQDNAMAYCIFVLMQRVGLSSTEIAELRLEDFAAYDNGVYVSVHGRKDFCFVPEDAFMILEQYLNVREEREYLFYNSRGNQLNTMYISRLMKKYTQAADVPGYSAESLRNSCAVTMFAYNASPEQVAKQMGITEIQIKRYKNMAYRDKLMRAANELVKIRVELLEK